MGETGDQGFVHLRVRSAYSLLEGAIKADAIAALAAAGQGRLLDDGEVGFTHFGSPGWLLQRIEAEKAA